MKLQKMLLGLMALVLFVGCDCGCKKAATADPKANEKAVVVAGNARFTVLTSQLIRMEWAEDGKFEDNATLTFVNRNLPVPEFTVEQNDAELVIKTADVTLTYVKGAKFSAENLKAEFMLNGEKQTWTYGKRMSGVWKPTIFPTPMGWIPWVPWWSLKMENPSAEIIAGSRFAPSKAPTITAVYRKCCIVDCAERRREIPASAGCRMLS